MNDLTIITGNANQTPIEIALGIDENGMTTAKKLYEFLQFAPQHYSRWCKRNITENPFAEENVDFWAFTRAGEWGGQATTDYRLTAKFAKKLSMMQKNERGEQAREYFTKVEDMAVDMANAMQNTKTINNNIQLLAQGHMQLQGEIESLRAEINELKMTPTELLASEARKISSAVSNVVVKTLGGTNSEAYKNKKLMKKLFTCVYSAINKQMGVSTYRQIRSYQVDNYIKAVYAYTATDELINEINECNKPKAEEI